MYRQPLPLFLCLLLAAAQAAAAAENQKASPPDTSRGDALASEYFRRQTERLSERTFAGIETLEDWEQRRGEYRRQLLEMLGLDPMPERTPLEPVITGRTEHEAFTVERLHFQSMPGLYVTGNLYVPKKREGKLPAILYVCGHARVKQSGVSYGNKVAYHHHGAWFARNGYVCLTIDTIQLGEIEGLHHGTYHEDMWWWNNRGYTPAGVETWNCIRAIDYLQSREEVDGEAIGMTGRSGGGVYTWWTAAVDERIRAAVPVAGITTLENHVVDGCVEGHCDCMFMINTYRWDYPLVAALVAPRPLLISNSDKDGIFPLGGVVELHRKVRKIYRLSDAGDKLGLHITEGPHRDTQELRVAAFRWMNRFLKDDESLVEDPAVKFFDAEQLKVFEELPEDQRVSDIHESFVPKVARGKFPKTRKQFQASRRRWMKTLKEKTFAGWPRGEDVPRLDVASAAAGERDGVRVRLLEFTSEQPYRLPLVVVEPADGERSGDAAPVRLEVLDTARWQELAAAAATVLPDQFSAAADSDAWKELSKRVRQGSEGTLVFLAPRGVGPTEWSRDERERTHIRRRFMLLGQTADGMRIWDVRRGVEAVEQVDALVSRPLHLAGVGRAAAWALHAALFAEGLERLELNELPASNREGISLLNVSRNVEMPQVVLMAAARAGEVMLSANEDDASAWAGVKEAAKSVLPKEASLEVVVNAND